MGSLRPNVERLLGEVGYGVGVALRAGVVPALLGLRWTQEHTPFARDGIPKPIWDLRLTAKAALDEMFFATELISATIVSLGDHERVKQEVSTAEALYQDRGWIDEPASFHVTPPPIAHVEVERIASIWGTYRHLRFASEYEPHPDEPGRDRWLAHTANRTAHARLFRHPGRPRPWLVCIPGYRMGHPAVDFAGLRARWLYEILGLNVAIPVLPLHGPRRQGRRGGDGFLTGDFVDTIHAQAQAVWDIRRLLGWLRAEGVPGLGVYGVSLGGYTTALIAGLEHDIDCVIAGIPAADFLRLVRRHVPAVLQQTATYFGFPFERIERMLQVISPLALPPLVPRERRYLYGGVADRLASPDHVHDLWHHWQQPHLAWYEGSHVSFLWEARVEELLRHALQACGLWQPPATAR
jgi:hypothetical protein